MANDSIADLLTRLRNASKARLTTITMPYARINADICTVLEEEGFIRAHRLEADGNKRNLVVELKYFEGEPVIHELKRVSTSGLRRYSAVKKLPKHFNGLGISILSTNKGVMSDFAARQAQVGGEVLCTVF
ncbi:MAG: 30S ribosomal protein S8 [Alphaproteobacteria bacterium]